MSFLKIQIRWLICVCMIAGLSGCGEQIGQIQIPFKMGQTGSEFPDIKIFESNGEFLRTYDLHFNFLLVSILDPNYPAARAQIRMMDKAGKTPIYRDLQFLGLFIHRRPVEFLQYFTRLRRVGIHITASTPAISLAFGGITSHPTSFLIDSEFIILRRYEGYLSGDRLLEDLNGLEVMKRSPL